MINYDALIRWMIRMTWKRLAIFALILAFLHIGFLLSFASSDSKVIPAEEIASKVRVGQSVDYDNVIIVGFLNLSGLEKDVSHLFRIRNSTFSDAANFENAVFKETVDLGKSTFKSNVSFGKTRFVVDSNFSNAKLEGETDFHGAEFQGRANFIRSSILDDSSFDRVLFAQDINFAAALFNETSFDNARFEGDAIFIGSNFTGNAEFDFARFSRLANFWNALFWKDASFTNAKFEGPVIFKNADFKGDTSFAAASFAEDVVFRSAKFRGNATFGLSHFGGFSDFADVDFQGLASFIVTEFSDNAYFVGANFAKDLILEGSRIYSMQLDDANFAEDSKISLKDADFNKFAVRWDIIKNHLLFNGAAYIALVKNYKNLEWFKDADNAYFDYRRISMDSEPWGSAKLIDIIAWLSSGYGIRISYVTFWCIFTIVFFGIIFWVGNGMKRFEITGLEIPTDNDIKDYRVSLIDAMYFSTAMFTTSQAPVNNYPVGFYRHLAMLEGIMGWFFLGLYIVVLVSVLVR
jgi:hypothetical protein